MNKLSGKIGILIVDKPVDFTSFDLCAKLRGMLKTRKIGHAGTLDPMATGVMTVLLGNATRAAELLPIQDKRYEAGFRLGITTDTLDITGRVLTEQTAWVSGAEAEAALDGLRGDIMQIPPMYSAVHHDGQRLYELAYRGLEVEREARPVTVYRLALIEFDAERGEGRLDIHCSRGTYIRTLIDDMGRALGCGAVMTSLRRTMASGFTIDDALTLGQIQELTDAGSIDDHILPVECAFAAYRRIMITPAQANRYINGGELNFDRLRIAAPLTDGELVQVCGESGFIGIGRADAGELVLRPYKRFV